MLWRRYLQLKKQITKTIFNYLCTDIHLPDYHIPTHNILFIIYREIYNYTGFIEACLNQVQIFSERWIKKSSGTFFKLIDWYFIEIEDNLKWKGWHVSSDGGIIKEQGWLLHLLYSWAKSCVHSCILKKFILM